jgi:competence protein ComEA
MKTPLEGVVGTTLPGWRIDLDRADPQELALLPGVGPSLAAAIVADREARGPFRSPENLGRVRGVGPAILEQIRPFVLQPAP